MKKQIAVVILICVILLALMVTLNSCGGSGSLSGNYINSGDSTEYLEFFAGTNGVNLNKTGKPTICGWYKINGDNLTISFDLGGSYSDMSFRLNKSRDKIYQGDVTFIKGKTDTEGNIVEEKGFWAKHWPKFVIGIIVIGIIGAIYNKVTGRDLGDDLDELEDRIDDALDDSDKDKKTK